MFVFINAVLKVFICAAVNFNLSPPRKPQPPNPPPSLWHQAWIPPYWLCAESKIAHKSEYIPAETEGNQIKWQEINILWLGRFILVSIPELFLRLTCRYFTADTWRSDAGDTNDTSLLCLTGLINLVALNCWLGFMIMTADFLTELQLCRFLPHHHSGSHLLLQSRSESVALLLVHWGVKWC